MRYQRSNTITGFTLIEALLVVALIVLLLGLLLPMLGKAKRAARRAQCATSLHHMGVAAGVFRTEHAQSFWEYNRPAPPEAGGGTEWWFGHEPAGGGGGAERPLDVTAGIFSRYLSSVERMQCPAFPYDDAQFFAKFDRRAASFGYNWRLSGLRKLGSFGLPDAATPPHHASRYAHRAGDVFVFADSAFFEPGEKFNEGFYIDLQANVTTLSGYAHFRHDEQANVVFIDGHVDALSNRGDSHRLVADAETGNLGAAADGFAIYGD